MEFHIIQHKKRNKSNEIPVISATFSSAEIEIFLLTEFHETTETERNIQKLTHRLKKRKKITQSRKSKR